MHSIKSKITTEITITLTEGEARALDAICGYGSDIFLEWFHKTHGKHYIRDHEIHVESLFEKGRALGKAFYELQKAREAIIQLNTNKAIPVPKVKFWKRWQQKLFKTTTAPAPVTGKL